MVRETDDEAQAADRLIADLDDDTIAKAQAAFAKLTPWASTGIASLRERQARKI
ncbi:hypothetical protein ACNKHO_06070 [Shigella flexneri]